MAVSRGIIWGASLDEKIWKPLQTEAQISNFLHGLGIRCYGNTVRWFASRISGDSEYKAPGFFETANLWGKVSFADGLLDVRTNNFVERSLDDRVTAVLRYAYRDITLSPHYERLTEAMKALTVTESSYLRLQEFCGVALHAEPSGRILYFQHHNPRIASIFTKIIGKVWSEDDVSFLGLRDHEKAFRTAQVLEHPVVISGKEGESTLRDVSTVLALADGDGINVDRKNQDPFDFVGRCSLICAGKNLPSLQKGSMGTFRYYLIRVNLTGDMSDGMSIRDILSMPKEFILWSLEGLRRFISNKGRFTFDEGSDIPREDASFLIFVDEMIVPDPNGKIPSSALYDAYSSYCTQHDMPVLPKPRLVSYLRETFQIESRTIRVPWNNGGAPSFGYVGIRFSEPYQALLTELSEDSGEPAQWNSTIYDEDEDDEDYDTQNDDSWYPDFQPTSEMIILSD